MASARTADKALTGCSLIRLDQLISSPANAAVGLLSQSTHDGRFLLTVTEVTRVSISKHEEARGDVHFRRLFAVIRAYLDDLDAGRFVFRPGFGCSLCDYRDDSCRRWDG